MWKYGVFPFPPGLVSSTKRWHYRMSVADGIVLLRRSESVILASIYLISNCVISLNILPPYLLSKYYSSI